MGGGGDGWEINKSSFFPMTPLGKTGFFMQVPPILLGGPLDPPPPPHRSAYTHALNSFTEQMHTIFFWGCSDEAD